MRGARNATPKNMFAPAARIATANSSSFDALGYDAVSIFLIAGTWTDGTHALKLQESADNSTFTDVASTDALLYDVTTAATSNAAAFTTISSAPTAVNTRMSYIGGKRYLRIAYTAASTTTGAVFAVLAQGAEARNVPAL